MPTLMNPRHVIHHGAVERTAPQKICISFSVLLIVIGLMGVLTPGLLGMHLSMAHNMINITSGAIALYCGYSTSNKAINFCLWFGAIYGLMGIVGFVVGEPGYSGVGNMEADQNLFRAIPNILEFGTMDHIIHLLISAFLLFTAFTFRKERKNRGSRVNHLNRIEK